MAIDVESRIGPATGLVGNVDCSIPGRNFDVTMQAITVGPGKDRHCRTEGCAAIYAKRTDSVSNVLRTVVARVFVTARNSSGKRRREWAAPDRLVVDT